jgi:predicted Zn-dependent protease
MPSARTDVNWKLLWLSTGVLVVMIVGIFITYKYTSARRRRNFLAWGDEAVAKGQYTQAADDYSHALTLKPNDPDVELELGDVLAKMSLGAPDATTATELATRAANCWQGALNARPGSMPALQRLFEYHLKLSQTTPSTAQFSSVRDLAERIASLDSNDARAQSYRHIAALQPWLYGAEQAGKLAQSHIDALTNLVKKDPSDMDRLHWLVMAKLAQASDFKKQSDTASATTALSDAGDLCKTALAGGAKSAGDFYGVAGLFVTIANACDDSDKTLAMEQADRALARQAIDQARTLATASDPAYQAINLSAAEIDAQQGDRAAAETIYRELLARAPSERVVLDYARFLTVDADRYDDALNLLLAEKSANPATSNPAIANASPATVPAPNGDKILRLQALLEIAQIRIAQCSVGAGMPGEDRRIALAKQACDEATAALGIGPETLKLQARFAEMQGRDIEAIQLLNRADDLLQKSKGNPDVEIAYFKAIAFDGIHETDKAIDLLHKVINQSRSYVPARMLLVTVLLGQAGNDPGGLMRIEADQQLLALEKNQPDDPNVIGLRISYLVSGPHTDDEAAQVKMLFDRLPETTRHQQIQKARIAVAIGDNDDAIRLLKANPVDLANDPQASALLAQAQAGGAPVGIGVGAAGVGTTGAGPAGTDDFSRELSAGKSALSAGAAEDAIAHLTHARQLNPSSGEVVDLLFQAALTAQDWNLAAACEKQLADNNSDQVNGLTYQIRLELARGQMDLALASARELSQKLPDLAASWTLLGKSLLAAGQVKEASGDFDRALSLRRDDLDAVKGQIQCAELMNESVVAAEKIASARQAYPDDADLRELELIHELTYGNLADVMSAHEQLATAEPDRADVQIDLARVYLQAAATESITDAAASAQHLARARTLLTGAVQRWPENQSCLVWAATAALQARDEPAGEKYLRTLLDQSWNDPVVAIQLAMFLSSFQRYDDAIAVLLPLTRDPAPENPRVEKTLSELYVAAKRPADAEAFLRAVLAKHAGDAPVEFFLGIVLIDEQKFDEAIGQLTAALTADPGNAEALYNRGLAELRKSPPSADLAIADLTAARDRNPVSPEIRLALAQVYVAQANPAMAIAELESALPLMPLNKSVRQTLLDLYSTASPPQWDKVAALTADAEAMPQLQNDPTWPFYQAEMEMAHDNIGAAADKIHDAIREAPADATLPRAGLEILLAAREYPKVIEKSELILKGGSPVWWASLLDGEAKYLSGDKDGALPLFTAALDGTASDLPAAIIAAKAIAGTAGKDQALALLQKESGRPADWRLVSAEMLWDQRDDADAITTVDACLADLASLSADNQRIALELATDIYAHARPSPQWDKAHDAYLKLLNLRPNDVTVLNNLACFLADETIPPRLDEALTYSQRAYNLLRSTGHIDPAIADTEGWVLTLQGKADQAIPILEPVVEQLPLPDTNYHLAEAYLQKLNPHEAQRRLQLAQALADEATKKGTPISAALQSRIDNAMSRAQLMILQQEPVGTSQPAGQ